jgi:hypothetical protein
MMLSFTSLRCGSCKFFQNFLLQYLFGPDIGDLRGKPDDQAYWQAVEGVVDLQKRLTDLPVGRVLLESPSGSGQREVELPHMSFTSHSHFVNYGGNYQCSIPNLVSDTLVEESVSERNVNLSIIHGDLLFKLS